MERAVAEFSWDEGEYLRLTRKYGVPRVFMRNIGLGVATSLGLGVTLSILHIHAALLLYLVAAMYVMYGRWYWKSIARRTWHEVPGLQVPQRVVFTSSGVRTHTSITDRTEKWDAYKYVAERDDCYLLGRNRRVVTLFLPKRGFSSRRGEALFRALVRSHSQAFLVPDPQLDDSTLP
jgi:hypothetical protein